MKAIYVDFEVWLAEKFQTECEQIPGIEVCATFRTAADALTYLRSNAVDIVFLDIELPDLDGFTLAEMIRAAHPGIVIVYFSAYGGDTVSLMEKHNTSETVVLKPYDTGDLASAISAACCS